MKYSKLSKTHRTIKEWSPDDRPREKLITHGAEVLSDAELLAILINTGTVRRSALDVARDLLNRYTNLPNLASRSHGEISRESGIGMAKATKLIAAFELGRRIQSQAAITKTRISSPEEVAAIYLPKTRDWKKEKFLVVLLDAAGQIICDRIVTEGILNASMVHPREVFKLALDERAASLILIHNHPSGNPTPSPEDIRVTEQLVKAGEIIGIPVKDHLIVAGQRYTSLAKEGVLTSLFSQKLFSQKGER